MDTPLPPAAVVSWAIMQEQETEYAVSPNTPLLSTEVQQNAWVCGEQDVLASFDQCLEHQGALLLSTVQRNCALAALRGT